MNAVQWFLLILAAICVGAEMTPVVKTQRTRVKFGLLALCLLLLILTDKAA